MVNGQYLKMEASDDFEPPDASALNFVTEIN
jgi:hypothetical protein